MKRVLIISACDSSGLSGMAADIRTVSTLGCFPQIVVTAVTAQSKERFISMHPVPASLIAKQIKYNLKNGIDAIKIGVLGNLENAKAICLGLEKTMLPIIFDPVIKSSSGFTFMRSETIDYIISKFIRIVDIITPNIDETEILCGYLSGSISSRKHMEDGAKKLIDLGAKSVLIKGGHLPGDISYDLFASKDERFIWRRKKQRLHNSRGSGCIMSSAISSYIARAEDLKESLSKSRDYVYNYMVSKERWPSG